MFFSESGMLLFPKLHLPPSSPLINKFRSREPRQWEKEREIRSPSWYHHFFPPNLSSWCKKRNIDDFSGCTTADLLKFGIRRHLYWLIVFLPCCFAWIFLRYFCEGWPNGFYWSDHLLPHGVCQDTAAATVQSKSCDLYDLDGWNGGSITRYQYIKCLTSIKSILT